MSRSVLNNALFKIAWAPALVLIVHVIATIGGWYESLWWFDIPMHFAGGMAISFSAYHLLEYFTGRKMFNNTFIPLQVLILIAFTGLGAAGWEMLEFGFDAFLNTNLQPGIIDTIKDMAVGCMGGGLVAVLTIFKK